MADLDTIRARIDAIDTLLSGGVKSSSVGDMRVDYDLQALQAERERLTRILAGSGRSQYKRVVFKHG